MKCSSLAHEVAGSNPVTRLVWSGYPLNWMQLPQTTRVRKATPNDLRAILDILADAFEPDPVMKWVTPKSTYPRYAFSLTVPSCMEHAHTYITEDGSGAASWLPPREAPQLRVSPGVVWKGLTEYGPGSLIRGLATLIQTQKRHPGEDHYYLFTIGTRRSHQRGGAGGALMREVLTKCDDERMPAYLESSNVDNLPFVSRQLKSETKGL